MTHQVLITLEELRKLEMILELAETTIQTSRCVIGNKIDQIASENLPRNDEVEAPRRRPRPQKEPEVK
jgi:hypothetical protein